MKNKARHQKSTKEQQTMPSIKKEKMKGVQAFKRPKTELQNY